MNYAPYPGISRTQVPSPATVRLQVSDARRAESPVWIADKKNGYGMRMASIVVPRPVADILKDAIAQELTVRGVRIGEGGLTITVDITRFESVYQSRFFSVGAIASADLLVQVRRPDGTIVYVHPFSVSNDDEASLVGTPSLARESIESALSRVVSQVISDPAFLAALSAVPRTS